MCEITAKLPFLYLFKKKYKKTGSTRPKKVFRKDLLHKIVLIWQCKIKSQQNYFCTKKKTKNLFSLQK